MIFSLEIPELQGPQAFPGQLLNVFLGPQCSNYAGQAMLTSFVRFVEAAQMQYHVGSAAAQRFVDESQNLYSFFDASSAFEACIGYMHRAIRCMKAIRSQKEVAVASLALFPKRPAFMADDVQKQLRNVRDAIQHNYEKVFDGSIPQGTPFMLTLAGTEVLTPTADNARQTTKTWNGVEIGEHRISFADISAWLNQMAFAAEAIVTYRPADS